MNLSTDWIAFLRSRGHEALHWSSVGSPAAPDPEIVTWAMEHEAVVMTCDLDFGRYLALLRLLKPSVIQVRSNDLRPETLGATIARAIAVTSELLISGALLSVGKSGVRVRKLPID